MITFPRGHNLRREITNAGRFSNFESIFSELLTSLFVKNGHHWRRRVDIKTLSGSKASAFAAAARLQTQQLHDMKLQNINDKAELARLMAEIGKQAKQYKPHDIDTGLVFEDNF